MMIRKRLLPSIFAIVPAAASPVGMAPSPDGNRLFIALENPPSVEVVDANAGTIAAKWPLPTAPRSLAITPDGMRLFVPAGIAPGALLTINPADGAVIDSQPAGHSPCAATVSSDGGTVFICDQFANRVEIFKPAEKRVIGNFPAIREPVASVLRPDGKVLFVTNLLPSGAANTGDVAAELGVIDTTSGQAAQVRLPNGSTDARALTVSADGRFVYVVHTFARYALPTTQLDRGWMNTSALSVIDAAQPRVIATVLLDDIDLGAANPAAVACSRDGKILGVAHAGTHEVSLIDRAALHDRIDRAGRGEAVTEVSHSAKDIPNDLSFLHGIRRRIKLTGNGPRTLVATAEGFAAACYFSNTLHLLKTGPDLTATVRDVVLGPNEESQARKGERMFFDATRCFQQWQSCATCHPGVRTDSLNWDLLNDGVGNPKQTKSMLFTLQTPPAMISGIRPNGETAIRTGMRYIMFVTHPEEDALAIEAFFKSMQAVPSPALVDGKLSPAAERGKAVFEQAGCADCHSGQFLTDKHLHDVGTGTGRETGKEWDTPALREIWRTAPYLHDGRAPSLDDVVGSANPDDKHGETSTLTADQRRDLVEYIRSL